MSGWRRSREVAGEQRTDPFAELGLTARGELTDDDVRAAWRRIAAATHPDRADGGDPDRFARAAAAYTELRTAFGRNEARAALPEVALLARQRSGVVRARQLVSWSRPGRRVRLLLRAAVAIVAAVLGALAAGHSPAAPALATGALTWLLLTTRQDLRH